MDFWALTFMLLLAVVMIYSKSLYKKKDIEKAKTLTIISGSLIILISISNSFCKKNVDLTEIDREKAYQRVQALMLSNALTNMYSGKGKCLLIHDDTNANINRGMARLVSSLKEGFGGKITDVVDISITTYAGGDNVEHFNQVIRAHADCDIVIIMTPLPYSLNELIKLDIFRLIQDPNNEEKWIKDPRLKYPLVGVFNISMGNLEPFIVDRLISAMAIWKPKPEINKKQIPESIKVAFDERYLLITPDNIAELKKQFPACFPEPKE